MNLFCSHCKALGELVLQTVTVKLLVNLFCRQSLYSKAIKELVLQLVTVKFLMNLLWRQVNSQSVSQLGGADAVQKVQTRGGCVGSGLGFGVV